MREGTGAVLREAAQQVLETMFFVVPSAEAPPAAAGAGGPYVGARIAFCGEPPGAFAVSLPEPAARTIAANFLGAEAESELPLSCVREVVAELANMICGAVLSRLETESRFELDAPEVLAGLEDPHAGRALVESLPLDGGVLRASIEFRAGA
jgi:CheY-specific phosphatase CheX